jgi:hypothetical protein
MIRQTGFALGIAVLVAVLGTRGGRPGPHDGMSAAPSRQSHNE